MTEDQMRDLFREMREEPIPADSLARVRAGLVKRAPRRRWWILVPVAVGLSIVSFVMFRPAPPPVPGPMIVAKAAPATPQPVEIAPVQVPRPKRARPKQVAAMPVSMIRIETPDPEVVILLVN